MRRKRNCWDKAVAEPFFHTLETHFVRHTKLATRAEAELTLFEYIAIYYNRRRHHFANGWLSLVEVEKKQDLKRVV